MMVFFFFYLCAEYNSANCFENDIHPDTNMQFAANTQGFAYRLFSFANIQSNDPSRIIRDGSIFLVLNTDQ